MDQMEDRDGYNYRASQDWRNSIPSLRKVWVQGIIQDLVAGIGEKRDGQENHTSSIGIATAGTGRVEGWINHERQGSDRSGDWSIGINERV
jgi:hypothetical protein